MLLMQLTLYPSSRDPQPYDKLSANTVPSLILHTQGPLGTSTPAKLIAAAFPALHRLELTMSLKWKDLDALTSCSQLSCLCLSDCDLPATAPPTNPLASLASLKELHVFRTSSIIAQGLTQLTSLHVFSRTDTLSQHIMPCLNGMQHLQQLHLTGSDGELPAALVAQIFSAAPNLTGLSLFNTIGQPAFDALLAHGTQLTRLTCYDLQLSEGRSQSACSWEELEVHNVCCMPRMLAYLPLRSLSRVRLGSKWGSFAIPSPCPSLTCQLTTPSGTTAAEIQAALTNLATWPVWQASAQSVRVILFCYGSQPTVEEQLMQSVSALAAWASRKVQLVIDVRPLSMSAHIVEHLQAQIGASLTHLTLQVDTIRHDFWPAVWRHLPGLEELSIWSDLSMSVSSSDIAAFCSHATRPLSLRLGGHVHHRVGPIEQLEQQCRTWGTPQVTVTEVTEADL
jgi:hypothetical protein